MHIPEAAPQRRLNQGLALRPLRQEEFDLMREEWNRLLGRSPSDSVFLRWEWIHTWWSVFRNEERNLFILAARRDGRLVGIAPCYIAPAGVLGTRQLRLCSDEIFPDYLDIIAEAGSEAAVAREISRHLSHEKRDWDVAIFGNLRADAVLWTHRSFFRDFSARSRPSPGCPHIKIEGTFDEYFKSRHRTSHRSLEKMQRKLLIGKRLEHRIIRDEEALAKGMEHLFLLHDKRAEQKGRATRFSSPDARRFHRELSRLFLQARILDLHLLCDGEIPVSALYCFNYGNKVYFYQGGFDPQWGKWSVGTILLRLAVRRAFRDGCGEFDFLKGDEPYKYLWSNAVRDQMELTLYNDTPRGALSRATSSIHAFLRALKPRFLPRV